MDKFKRSLLNSKLKSLADEFERNYKTMHAASYNSFVKDLKPGQIKPEDNRAFYDNVYQGSFESLCYDLKERADSFIGEALTELKKEATAAPSQEALATVQMLALRKNISREEFNQVLEVYGDNAITYGTIKDIAEQQGIILDPNPNMQQLAELEHLAEETTRTFSPYGVGSSITVTAEALKMDIDTAIPAD